jgi:hypothetical protein
MQGEKTTTGRRDTHKWNAKQAPCIVQKVCRQFFSTNLFFFSFKKRLVLTHSLETISKSFPRF